MWWYEADIFEIDQIEGANLDFVHEIHEELWGDGIID